jgi:hypothetical protein
MHKLASITDFIRSSFQEPTEFIPLHDPRFIGNEKYEWEKGRSVGEFVGRFEQTCAEYTGAAYAVAAMNGTTQPCISFIDISGTIL